MKLYRIRRKDTGEFFSGLVAPWNPRHKGKVRWYVKGQFFQRIDTVEKWVQVLAGDFDFTNPHNHCTASKVIVKNVDRRKLENFEIVINDVSLHGEEVIQAIDLVKRKQK